MAEDLFLVFDFENEMPRCSLVFVCSFCIYPASVLEVSESVGLISDFHLVKSSVVVEIFLFHLAFPLCVCYTIYCPIVFGYSILFFVSVSFFFAFRFQRFLL